MKRKLSLAERQAAMRHKQSVPRSTEEKLGISFGELCVLRLVVRCGYTPKYAVYVVERYCGERVNVDELAKKLGVRERLSVEQILAVGS